MYALLLACVTGSSPAPDRAALPPAQEEMTVITRLDRRTMQRPDGTLHRGEVASGRDQTEWRAALGPGRYTLTVRGRATEVDGAPGRLALHMDGQPVGELLLEAGAVPDAASLEFSAEGVGERRFRLDFINDLYESQGETLRDRNLYLEEIALYAPDRPSGAARAQQIRESVRGANVLLIDLGAVRADRLAPGYPGRVSPEIDALAGVRFEEAFSASNWPALSQAALLTGQHPARGGAPDPAPLEAEIQTGAEILQAAGWRTGAFTQGRALSERLGFRQGFGDWEERDVPCGESAARAAAWLQARGAERQAGGAPFFLLYETDEAEPQSPAPGQDLTAAGLEAAIARYDAGVRAASACAGTLASALEQSGERGRTLVVLTSDHGEEFLEYGGFGHTRLQPVLVHVPLIFAHPALAALAEPLIGSVSGAVDVLPTLLDLVGVAGPGLPGISLLPVMLGEAGRDEARITSGGGEAEGVVNGAGTSIRTPGRDFFYPGD